MGVGGRHASVTLPPIKTSYSLYRELGGPQGQSGRVRKISLPTGIRSPARPARNESLHRLCYPRPYDKHCTARLYGRMESGPDSQQRVSHVPDSSLSGILHWHPIGVSTLETTFKGPCGHEQMHLNAGE
jgi:hypothetical protein